MSAFWDDVDAVQMTHSDEPTTAEEREGWLRDDEVYNDPTAVHDIIYRLIKHVDKLEAEVERGCPTCAHCQLKRGGHLD